MCPLCQSGGWEATERSGMMNGSLASLSLSCWSQPGPWAALDGNQEVRDRRRWAGRPSPTERRRELAYQAPLTLRVAPAHSGTLSEYSHFRSQMASGVPPLARRRPLVTVSREYVMNGLQMPDWGATFLPDLSLLESFVRGSAVYLSLVILFRMVLKRQGGGGSIGLPDLMLVVLVSECVSSSLSADGKSVANGLVTVFALLFWSFLLDWLAYRWPWLRRCLEPKPLQLVHNGQPIRAHLDRERISEDELAAQLRANGIDDVSRVKAAYIEGEGTISVIPAESGSSDRAAPPTEPATPPDPSTGFERAVQRFLVAAEEVRAVMEWHEAQALNHRAAAKLAGEVLARYGVRRPAARRGSSQPPSARTPSATS